MVNVFFHNYVWRRHQSPICFLVCMDLISVRSVSLLCMDGTSVGSMLFAIDRQDVHGECVLC